MSFQSGHGASWDRAEGGGCADDTGLSTGGSVPFEGGYARSGSGQSIPSHFLAFIEGDHIIDCSLEDGTRT